MRHNYIESWNLHVYPQQNYVADQKHYSIIKISNPARGRVKLTCISPSKLCSKSKALFHNKNIKPGPGPDQIFACKIKVTCIAYPLLITSPGTESNKSYMHYLLYNKVMIRKSNPARGRVKIQVTSIAYPLHNNVIMKKTNPTRGRVKYWCACICPSKLFSRSKSLFYNQNIKYLRANKSYMQDSVHN